MSAQNDLMLPLKRGLQAFWLYQIAREVKWCLGARFTEQTRLQHEVVSFRPEQGQRGYVLLSYILDRFLLKADEAIPNTHTNYWASLQMAKTFLDLGYSVDVISYLNGMFRPTKPYSIVIDVRHNLERFTPLLDPRCLKIMHIDAAHMLFHNAAEAHRLLELQQRKGATLLPSRQEIPNLCIEHADCATTTGNEFTIQTFRYANKPIYRIPIPAAVLCPWPEEKNFESCRNRFLWFASGGFIHKGLDLVLEAFAAMPEYHLTVCGPIQSEQAFVRVYHKELYGTANIHTVGWVNVNDSEFVKITNASIAFVYTSCSEGGGACAVTCMHAGLIPIVSYETSVDVHDFGVLLMNASVEEIKDGVRMVANLPALELEQRARKAWEFARANHTRQKFAEEYRRTVEQILATHGYAQGGTP